MVFQGFGLYLDWQIYVSKLKQKCLKYKSIYFASRESKLQILFLTVEPEASFKPGH